MAAIPVKGLINYTYTYNYYDFELTATVISDAKTLRRSSQTSSTKFLIISLSKFVHLISYKSTLSEAYSELTIPPDTRASAKVTHRKVF